MSQKIQATPCIEKPDVFKQNLAVEMEIELTGEFVYFGMAGKFLLLFLVHPTI